MLQPLLELYNLIDNNKDKFINRGLNPIEFMDVYRSQPLDPELYEYFPIHRLFYAGARLQ